MQWGSVGCVGACIDVKLTPGGNLTLLVGLGIERGLKGGSREGVDKDCTSSGRRRGEKRNPTED